MWGLNIYAEETDNSITSLDLTVSVGLREEQRAAHTAEPGTTYHDIDIYRDTRSTDCDHFL